MIYPSGDADIGGQTKPGRECGETEGAREWKLIRRGDRPLPRPKNQRGLHSPPRCDLLLPHEHAGKLFSERVVKVWNSLPARIVNFSSLATFRNSLNKLSLRIHTKY